MLRIPSTGWGAFRAKGDFAMRSATLLGLGLSLALGASFVGAQEIPLTPPPPAPSDEKPGATAERTQPKPATREPDADPAPEDKEASAGAGDEGTVVSSNRPEDQMKVLKPGDVPAELLRLKSKADIKAEVTVLPLHGRKVTVKGVVRNGKLIELFVGRRFVAQKDIENTQSGVRLWWVEGSAGWIFLRYSQIQSIALVGQLTPEERRAIMEALKARREGEEPKKPVEVDPTADLEKLSPEDLEALLLKNYPADKGWNHERLRTLKEKQIMEGQPLTREEAVFVKYFPVLIKARLKEVRRTPDKTEFEPGSQTPPAQPQAGEPRPIGPDVGDPQPEPAGDDEDE